MRDPKSITVGILYFASALFLSPSTSANTSDCVSELENQLSVALPHHLAMSEAETVAFIDAHAKDIKYLANRYARPEMAIDPGDIEGVARLEILEAIRKFDPSKGTDLWLFCWQRIKWAILREYERNSMLTRDRTGKFNQMMKAQVDFFNRNGRYLTDDELAKQLKISPEELEKLQWNLEAGKPPKSLHEKVNPHSEDSDELIHFIKDERPNALEELIAKEEKQLSTGHLSKKTKEQMALNQLNISPALKEELFDYLQQPSGSDNLFKMEKQAFIRAYIFGQNDDEIAKALDLQNAKNTWETRGRAVSKVREHLKTHFPELSEEFDTYLKDSRKAKVLARRTKIDSKPIEARLDELEQPKLSPGLKHALGNAIATLNEKPRQAFLKTYLDLTEEKLKTTDPGSTIRDKFNALRRLRELIHEQNDPKMTDEFEAFLKSREGLLESVKTDKALASELNQAIRNLPGSNPNFKQYLENSADSLSDLHKEVFLKTVLGNTSDQQIARELGYQSTEQVMERRRKAISGIRSYLQDFHPDSVAGFDRFIESVRKAKNANVSASDLLAIEQRFGALNPSVISSSLKPYLITEISHLNPAQRDVFLNTVVGSERDEELASRLNLSKQNVIELRGRAIQTLQRWLEKDRPNLAQDFDHFIESAKNARIARNPKAPASPRKILASEKEISAIQGHFEKPDLSSLSVPLRSFLETEVTYLNREQREVFLNTVIGSVKDDALGSRMSISEKEVQILRGRAMNNLKIWLKKDRPDLKQDYDSFISTRFRAMGRRVPPPISEP